MDRGNARKSAPTHPEGQGPGGRRDMAYAQGDYTTAEERWEEAFRLSRSEEDILAEAMAWVGTGLIEMVRPNYEAAASSIEKALPLFDRCGQDSSLEGYGSIRKAKLP